MLRENRVTPEGAIRAAAGRGLLTGNRGILCDDTGQRRWNHRHKAWISCVLDYRGHRQPLASARSWTPLFFLDEAVALAAGHRPCARCRRVAYHSFRAAWAAGLGTAPRAAEMDNRLHHARLEPGSRRKRLWQADLADLPDGSFVALPSGAHLLLCGALRPWSPAGYGPALPRTARPTGPAAVLTPEPVVALLRAGYLPLIHPSGLA